MNDEKTASFLRWFNGLTQNDQSDVIDLVYDEFKVRRLVDGFLGLTPEQRHQLFDRLQIPRDISDKLSDA